MKKKTLWVVDPYNPPHFSKLGDKEQVLVQFKNGAVGIGAVFQQHPPCGDGYKVLVYSQGRATRVVKLAGQGE